MTQPTIIDDYIVVNNFGIGRKGWQPDRIVIHVEEGSEAATDSWFDNDSSDVSSHYTVDKEGVIRRKVRERDSAWTQGRVDNPTAKIVLARPNVNPNYYCISIEHEGDGKHDLTDKQRESSAWLICNIRIRFPKIQLNRDYILKHHEIYSKKTCPGNIDVERLIALAVSIELDNHARDMLSPKVVWSDYFKDYLIVTKVVSDSEWYFIPYQQLQRQSSIKNGAGTLLSQMKPTPVNQ